MTSSFDMPAMKPAELVDYNVARARDLAFDAVHSLWRRRQSEGLTQADLAKFLARDEAWISRTLSGPGNWTLKTVAALVAGLNGELEIEVLALEDPPPDRSNYDAYAGYFDLTTATSASAVLKDEWYGKRWLPDSALSDTTDEGKVFLELRERGR